MCDLLLLSNRNTCYIYIYIRSVSLSSPCQHKRIPVCSIRFEPLNPLTLNPLTLNPLTLNHDTLQDINKHPMLACVADLLLAGNYGYVESTMPSPIKNRADFKLYHPIM